jgi:hypothetical protein
MILRRFMKHITDQNWFAVGLDVIVVIVGIFLGLQVQAWYEAKSDREAEQKYLHRLHDETERVQLYATGVLNLSELRYAGVLEVLSIISDDMPRRELNSRECFSILASSHLTAQVASIPVIVELTSSGRLSIITNELIRSEMSAYASSLGLWRGIVEDIKDVSTSISRRYSDIFKLDKKMNTFPGVEEELDQYNHSCDLEMMIDNYNFQNDLTLNSMALHSFIDMYNRPQVTILEKLHKMLDDELGINHPD